MLSVALSCGLTFNSVVVFHDVLVWCFLVLRFWFGCWGLLVFCVSFACCWLFMIGSCGVVVLVVVGFDMVFWVFSGFEWFG